MEYQFIKDPIYGIRCKMSDEHTLIGRWLSDEIGVERLAVALSWLSEIKTSGETHVEMGREIRLTLTRQEALFESHALFHEDESLLDEYRDDHLSFEEEGLVAVCGFEDFEALLVDFEHFVRGR